MQAITSGKSSVPFKTRHFFSADCISLNTIVRHAVREPLPFVLRCRRTRLIQAWKTGCVPNGIKFVVTSFMLRTLHRDESSFRMAKSVSCLTGLTRYSSNSSRDASSKCSWSEYPVRAI